MRSTLPLENGEEMHNDENEEPINGERENKANKLYQTTLVPFQIRQRGSEGYRKRKLVLHFDVRNTVLVADSVTNVSMEQALNSFLAGVVWGREKEDGEWEWMSDEPSLKPPVPGSKTYYRHLEMETVKTPNDRQLLRMKTGDFAQSELGSKFLSHFNRHLECLRWNHTYDEAHDKRLTMKGADEQPYHYILPSVYKLIYALVEENRDFSVIIRTYGLDCSNVLTSLAYGLKGNHPGFPKDARIPVSVFPGSIRRKEEEITLETVQTDYGDVKHKLNHERDIYRHLSNSYGISGYKDDFQIWQDKLYHHSVAKPLWLDPQDKSVHHIFFDDNFRSYEEDSIVDLRMFDSEDKTKARSLNREEIEKFEDVCLVQADLLESLENEDYFIEKVDKCERTYSKFLKIGEL